jgi:glutathione S-transferase
MTANDLKLYHLIASSISRWVHIVRAEKGLTVPSLLVDLGMGEQHSEAHRAINPHDLCPHSFWWMAAR